MFKKLLEKKYLKELKGFTADKLLDEYFELRSKGNMLYSMNVFQHDDIEHWKICEDFLINTKKIDENLLDDYAKIKASLEGNCSKEEKKVLKENAKKLKTELIELLEK